MAQVLGYLPPTQEIQVSSQLLALKRPEPDLGRHLQNEQAEGRALSVSQRLYPSKKMK